MKRQTSCLLRGEARRRGEDIESVSTLSLTVVKDQDTKPIFPESHPTSTMTDFQSWDCNHFRIFYAIATTSGYSSRLQPYCRSTVAILRLVVHSMVHAVYCNITFSN
ncbi:hypothetical protein KC19_VG127900 [Ceratodon purpureus]|uniref:Uncharacterized protein n=1 Tax=Ceratodon purpureus TaxID=3225 RepID=A0A8T0HPV1_CERPU|nr:hypothetical protein KC19_VG127900 [Ceratodon purpureus]